MQTSKKLNLVLARFVACGTCVDRIVMHKHELAIQSNLINMDPKGTEPSVCFTEVSIL